MEKLELNQDFVEGEKLLSRCLICDVYVHPEESSACPRCRKGPLWTPDGLLRLLTGGTGADAAAALGALINERALGTGLPDGCLGLRPGPAHAVACADALTVLAILTKCSDCVWLRHKTPSLGRLERQQAVSLLLLPAFAAAFQEQSS